jgi:hypothetical protein
MNAGSGKVSATRKVTGILESTGMHCAHIVLPILWLIGLYSQTIVVY